MSFCNWRISAPIFAIILLSIAIATYRIHYVNVRISEIDEEAFEGESGAPFSNRMLLPAAVVAEPNADSRKPATSANHTSKKTSTKPSLALSSASSSKFRTLPLRHETQQPFIAEAYIAAAALDDAAARRRLGLTPRQMHFVKRIYHKKGLRVLFIGGSNTAGVGGFLRNRYPQQLFRWIKRSMPGTVPQHSMLNLGVGGYGSRANAMSAAARLRDALASHEEGASDEYDLIVLDTALNDGGAAPMLRLCKEALLLLLMEMYPRALLLDLVLDPSAFAGGAVEAAELAVPDAWRRLQCVPLDGDESKTKGGRVDGCGMVHSARGSTAAADVDAAAAAAAGSNATGSGVLASLCHPARGTHTHTIAVSKCHGVAVAFTPLVLAATRRDTGAYPAAAAALIPSYALGKAARPEWMNAQCFTNTTWLGTFESNHPCTGSTLISVAIATHLLSALFNEYAAAKLGGAGDETLLRRAAASGVAADMQRYFSLPAETERLVMDGEFSFSSGEAERYVWRGEWQSQHTYFDEAAAEAAEKEEEEEEVGEGSNAAVKLVAHNAAHATQLRRNCSNWHVCQPHAAYKAGATALRHICSPLTAAAVKHVAMYNNGKVVNGALHFGPPPWLPREHSNALWEEYLRDFDCAAYRDEVRWFAHDARFERITFSLLEWVMRQFKRMFMRAGRTYSSGRVGHTALLAAEVAASGTIGTAAAAAAAAGAARPPPLDAVPADVGVEIKLEFLRSYDSRLGDFTVEVLAKRGGGSVGGGGGGASQRGHRHQALQAHRHHKGHPRAAIMNRKRDGGGGGSGGSVDMAPAAETKEVYRTTLSPQWAERVSVPAVADVARVPRIATLRALRLSAEVADDAKLVQLQSILIKFYKE